MRAINDQPSGHDYRVPIDPRVKAPLNDLGRGIGGVLPAGWGFTLLLFTFGDEGVMTYISNAQRADMVKAMQEFLAKQANA